MIHAALDIFLELAPWLLLGTVAAGLLHVLIPTEWLKRHLTGRGGVIKAVLVGVPLPLCSCGVIPVGLGLRKDGASAGASVGFLISTPQTGVDSILVSASFLGWPFAVFKVVAAMVTGLVGGWIADVVADDVLPPVETEPAESNRGGWQGFVDHCLMLIQSIWLWLVIGVAVSAAITWLVPENALSSLAFGSGLAAMLITLAISLPLYVCATASVPIAAALVASGLPAGAALVFLMAGPATNVATLGAVYRALGARALSVYLLTLTIGSIAAGLLFDSLIDATGITQGLHQHDPTWWRVTSAVVLGALLVWFAVDDLRRWVRRVRFERQSSAQNNRVSIPVTGMTCDGCAARLERELLSSPGVDNAVVSFADGRAVIDSELPADRLFALIENAGFHAPSGVQLDTPPITPSPPS